MDDESVQIYRKLMEVYKKLKKNEISLDDPLLLQLTEMARADSSEIAQNIWSEASQREEKAMEQEVQKINKFFAEN